MSRHAVVRGFRLWFSSRSQRLFPRAMKPPAGCLESAAPSVSMGGRPADANEFRGGHVSMDEATRRSRNLCKTECYWFPVHRPARHREPTCDASRHHRRRGDTPPIVVQGRGWVSERRLQCGPGVGPGSRTVAHSAWASCVFRVHSGLGVNASTAPVTNGVGDFSQLVSQMSGFE